MSTLQDVPAEVTVVTAPREGYARERDTLEHLLDGGEPISRIVVVHEARCPRRVERVVRDLARRDVVDHVHLPRRSGANACRAAGLAKADTPYVMLLDNDARIEAGALSLLVARAEAENASFVSPLVLNRDGTVHYAGSVVRFAGVEGRRHLVEMRHRYSRSDEIRPWLEAAPTDAPELHGVLVHADTLRGVGGPDTELFSSMDCLDLGLRLQDARGGGWLEPAAGVVYDAQRPVRDWRIYVDRWSRATVEHDIEQFTRRWSIDPSSERLDEHRAALYQRRWRAIPRVRGLVRTTLGPGAEARVRRAGDALMDRFSMARGMPRS